MVADCSATDEAAMSRRHEFDTDTAPQAAGTGQAGAGARMLTPPELARRWRVNPEKIIGFIRDGSLRAFNVAAKPGGRPRWRIDLADVLAFEQSRSAPRPAPQARRSWRLGGRTRNSHHSVHPGSM
jgi:hypothetical protein